MSVKGVKPGLGGLGGSLGSFNSQTLHAGKFPNMQIAFL